MLFSDDFPRHLYAPERSPEIDLITGIGDINLPPVCRFFGVR
jgi:hypothetical protein